MVEYIKITFTPLEWQLKKLKSVSRYTDVEITNIRFLFYEYEKKITGLEDLTPPVTLEEEPKTEQ